MVESDIASCVEATLHHQFMQAVEERISDGHVLKLLRALSRAGVMEDGQVRRSDAGTPQGGLWSAAHNEPCGDPSIVSDHFPSSMTSAANHFWTSRRTRLSAMRCSRNVSNQV